MKAIKSPNNPLTIILGNSRMEIVKPNNNDGIPRIISILNDNKIRFEEGKDCFVVFTKYYNIEALIALSCYYDLLVK